MIYSGVECPIEDQYTGVQAHFHAIGAYNVDLRNKMTTAVFFAYVSKEAFDKGKSPIFQTTATVPGLPPEEMRAVTWLYEAVTQQDGNPQNVFSLPEAQLIDYEGGA